MECKNCNKSVGDTYTYCPHCGQKMGLGRLIFKQLLRDLWIAFSNTDRGILLLVKQLVYRPGKVARDYISGKRKTYFNPFSYLVLMVAIALYFILQFENVVLNKISPHCCLLHALSPMCVFTNIGMHEDHP